MGIGPMQIIIILIVILLLFGGKKFQNLPGVWRKVLKNLKKLLKKLKMKLINSLF